MSRPITVLHVDSAREYRGGQNQVRLLFQGLAERGGVRQVLVAGRGSRLVEEARRSGVAVRPAAWRGAVSGPALVELRAAFRESWDVVHAHDSHALQSALAARALAGSESAVVGARRVDARPRRPRVWRAADLVVAVSARIRDVLIAAGVERRRVEVVHSGIAPADVAPRTGGDGADALRKMAGAGPDHVLVAAVGALVGHKGHAGFIRAAADVAREHEHARFAVFGEGAERPRLEALVSRLDLAGRFRLPGEFPGLSHALDGLDVFVMPSTTEGLGTACIEAMLAGRPIVATDAGGLPELSRGGAFRPVPAGDSGALATEIAAFVRSEDARRAAGEAARAAAERFTADRMVDGTLRCYRTLARRVC